MSKTCTQSLAKTLSLISQQRVSSAIMMNLPREKKKEAPILVSESSTTINNGDSKSNSKCPEVSMPFSSRRNLKCLDEKGSIEKQSLKGSGKENQKMNDYKKPLVQKDIIFRQQIKENSKPNRFISTNKVNNSPSNIAILGITFGDFLKKKEKVEDGKSVKLKIHSPPIQCNSPVLARCKPLILHFPKESSSPRTHKVQLSGTTLNSIGVDSISSYKVAKSSPKYFEFMHRKTLTRQPTAATSKASIPHQQKNKSHNLNFISFENYFETTSSKEHL